MCYDASVSVHETETLKFLNFGATVISLLVLLPVQFDMYNNNTGIK